MEKKLKTTFADKLFSQVLPNNLTSVYASRHSNKPIQTGPQYFLFLYIVLYLTYLLLYLT